MSQLCGRWSQFDEPPSSRVEITRVGVCLRCSASTLGKRAIRLCKNSMSSGSDCEALELDRQVATGIDQGSPKGSCFPPARIGGVDSKDEQPAQDKREPRMDLRWHIGIVFEA